MMLSADDRVLDIGSGIGGPARTLAETYGCRVTGVDLTQEFCDSAEILSGWVGLGQRTAFQQGDATDLPFGDDEFDAAITIHAAMNIAAKDKLYEEARRVLKPGRIFAVYDIPQGEGGDAVFPVPWAGQSSISHLVAPEEMESLLASAGFEILYVHDSTHAGQMWYEAVVERMERVGPPDLNFQAFVGADFREMARNQVRNLAERRIRTVSYLCRA
jgi:ubiquinone/menaquinone biosynthesis C-methylase UbiE